MKRFVFTGLIFALLFIFVPSNFIIFAQDTEKWFEIPGREYLSANTEKNKEIEKKVNIGDIVVTARNIPEVISLVTKDIQIIKPENEKLYGEDKIKNIIDNIPGLFVFSNGVNDSLSSVSVRGTGSKYTLVLLDGIPLNDFLTGGVDLSKIESLNIEKIEVIKSGMSGIYGTDASSGVINIITGADKKYFIKATGVYGTADLKKYSISSNSNIFNADYYINYTEEKKGDYFPNSDVDKKIANAKLSFSNKGLINIILNGSYLKRNMGIPFSFPGFPSLARQTDEDYSLGLTDVVNIDFMILRINGYLRSADLKYDDPDIYFPVHSRHIKKEYQASITGIYEEGTWLSLLGGFEWNAKDLDSTDVGQKKVLNNAGIINGTMKFLQEKLLINTGARIDFNSQYGNFNSENISISYKFPDKLEIYGLIDRSFSAPTFGQLYWPASVYDYGGVIYIYDSNPDLKPEQAISYEVGLKKSFEKMEESISIYYKDITDLIKNVEEVSGNTVTTKPVNIAWSKIMGLELSVSYTPFDFITISGKCDFKMEQNDKTNTGTAYSLGGYNIDSTYRIAALVKLPVNMTIGLNCDYISYNYDNMGHAIKPYFLMGGRLTQKISENFDIYLQVENIFDNKDYKSLTGYQQPGREYQAGMKIEF